MTEPETRYAASEPAFPDTLERCRRLVTPALAEAVGRLHPDLGRVAGFAFGWNTVDGTRLIGNGGKGLRPALAVLAAEAVGSPPESGVPAAAAVELLHMFSLVHDDIMDGDERRRHRATVWKSFGVEPAILVGDALLALSIDEVARNPAATVPPALRMLSSTLIAAVNGQAEDAAFEARPWLGPEAVTVEQYNAMAAGKTGALLGCAMALGALFGGAPAPTVAAMDRLGRDLGIAFQGVDDLLGIWGDPAVTGKPVYSDLRQRKKTLPVVAALSGDEATARRIIHSITASAGGNEALRRAADLIGAAGGRTVARAQTRTHLRRALAAVDEIAIDPVAAAELVRVVEFVGRRAC
ncbi:polyprenyl synthetase family protein [Nocardia sp. BMG51109]|uniref:polyprenyl synthetase family protein n=1 Tax=Nocardia sp. BMG51109 TaxID=1056816 RepID=UPI000466B5F9|nr:polyprenyl synthetase family protein [Nocardia sp. BMG51109]